jgi:hypothetical protein
MLEIVPIFDGYLIIKFGESIFKEVQAPKDGANDG